MTAIKPGDITRALRQLLPNVRPLSTASDLSGNGLVLSYTVTLPEPAARNIGVARLDTTGTVNRLLTSELGRPVHVADVYATRRTSGGKLVKVVIKTGAGS